MDSLVVYTALIACLVAVIFLNINTLRTAYLSPLSKIPGPWHAHLSNLRLKLAVISGNRTHYLHALHARYGPIVRVSPREVSTCDVDAFRTIYNARSGFPKDSWYKNFVFQDRPVVFAIPDNREHGERRKLLAKGFQKSLLRTDWEVLVAGFVRAAVRKIKEEGKKNGVVDVFKWWSFLSADVAGLIMFGSKDGFGMVDSGKENEFTRSLASRMAGEGIAVELPFVRTIEPYVPSKAFHQLFSGKDLIEKYARRAVVNAKSDTSTNVFTRIAQEAERGLPALTDEDVANEATNLTIAGSDTTGVTLTYLVWAVIKHPPAQSALETELATLTDADITDDALEKLPVLNAIIAETLRLYGAAPGPLPRTVPPGGSTLCGYPVPYGTTVSAQAWSLHRLPELWGADADVFDYTRWLPENEAARISEGAKAAFSPWGGPPRTCLGIHLAYMEMRLAAALFFRECRGARVADSMRDADMEVENYFLNRPRSHKCLISL